jgi:hypothetical protein
MPSRKAVLKVYLADEEIKQIVESANRSGLSLSTFAKRVCLGYEVKSVMDQRIMLELVRIGGNFGRLGGLLKYSLREKTLERNSKINRLIDELIIDKQNIMKLVHMMKIQDS